MINVPVERSATPPQTRQPSFCHQNSEVKGKDLISLLTLSHEKYALGAKATCPGCKPGRGDVQRAKAARQFGCHSSSRELREGCACVDVCVCVCVQGTHTPLGKLSLVVKSANSFFHRFLPLKNKIKIKSCLTAKKKRN